jgi:O-antigen ligase
MNHNSPAEWWRPGLTLDSGAQSKVIAATKPGAGDSAVPFWTLMIFTFILLVAPQTYFPVLKSLRIALLAAALAIALYLFDRFTHRQRIMKFTREMRITACLVGWAILTVPFSFWPGGSISFLLGFYFKTLTIFWLLSNIMNTLTRLRLVTWGLSLIGALLAISGVKQYLSGNFIAVDRIVGYDAPLTGNPNDLALMLNLILPLALALFLSNQKPIPRAMLLGIIVLLVVAIILTFSRGGFLTLGMILIMYQWKLRRRPGRGWAVAALVAALVCILSLPSGYMDRLSTIIDVEADPTGSAQERWDDMRAAMNFVLRNPLVGAGVGMNILALNEERGASWRVVHDVYLQYAVDLGVPGLVLFLLLLVGCIKCARFARRHSTGVLTYRELFYLAEGLEVSLVAFWVAGLFHPVAYHVYFYYIAGLAIAAKGVCEKVAD